MGFARFVWWHADRRDGRDHGADRPQAVLDVIRDEGLQENALKVGGEMLKGIEALAQKYADRQTKEPDGALGLKVVNRLREKRVLISASGPRGNVLKIRPPLPFTSENNRQFLQLLDETLSELV